MICYYITALSDGDIPSPYSVTHRDVLISSGMVNWGRDTEGI